MTGRDWTKVSPAISDMDWEKMLYDECDDVDRHYRYWHRVPALIVEIERLRALVPDDMKTTAGQQGNHSSSEK